MKISAVILTFNEEKEIIDCINGLKFCDEIIVVDSGSTDNTVKLAASTGADIYDHTFKDFADARNFGLKKSHGDWVFFVDADERIVDSLKKEIIHQLSKNSSIQGYFFKRDDFAFGQWLKHGETAKVRLLRLARKGSGEWRRSVHEFWDVTGPTFLFKTPIQHYSHASIEEFLKKINLYSSFDAKEHFQNGVNGNPWNLLLYPTAKFTQNYFWHLGFLDGSVGFIFAILMSINSFLIRAKLYLLWRNNARRN